MITYAIACFLWGWFSYDVTGGRYRYGIPLMIAGMLSLTILQGYGY